MMLKYYLTSVILVFFAGYTGNTLSITVDDIVDKCQSAENSIRDISMEYEWYRIPPWTHEEQEEPFKSVGILLPKDGITKHKLTASPFIDPNGKQQWRTICEESSVLTTEDGKSWEHFSKESYDGTTYKNFNRGGWPISIKKGTISSNSTNIHIMTTPIGFSVFRFESLPGNLSLSNSLKKSSDDNRIRLIDNMSKVNDFNVIRIDLLSKITNLPWTHIYFSIDHNYTPVRYEFLKSSKTGAIALTVDVQSLEKIGDGLWFPTSGTISAPDEKHVSTFQVIGKVLVNQGLMEKDFDIEFPVGTKVHDQIAKREYTVTEEDK